jgi:hypothetical protein
MDAGSEEQRRRGVAKVVEPQAGEFGLLEQRLERAVSYVARVQRPA